MSKKKKPMNNDIHDQVDYWDKLSPEEKEWLLQFNSEMYDDGYYYQDKPLIQTREMLSEANRTYKQFERDAFDVAQKQLMLVDLDAVDKKFMEDASDEWEWRDAYKVGGYKFAGHSIFLQTMKRLEEETDWEATLANFYVKMRNLDRYDYNIRRKGKKKNG